MAGTVEFFYDVGSPASYLAWTQLPALAARHGAEIRYRPMLLGGVFKATGNRSPAELPAKSRWMNADLARFARRYGVPFAQNPHFPINTLQLMRGAVAAQQDGLLEPYNAAVFRAIWVDGRNMSEPEVAAHALSEGGLEPREIFARLAEEAVKAELKATTEEAGARGVFGAPSLFVGEEMFFGQDRLDFVDEALAS
ncbi:MAG TPA: 2-hydroxychromene-2-carboxylate isomerase [Alphaproteobacteria bacterium]|nr:2-hydroxychromene-2-carboxylate isomerase [Alphaproteobacteria bacterium]